MSRVYIDEECKMCTSYGKWISSKNLNIDLNAQINLTPEEIELDTLVYEKDGSKYYFSDAVIQSISDIGGVYNLVKIIKIFPRFIRDNIYKIISIGSNKYLALIKVNYEDTLTDPEIIDLNQSIEAKIKNVDSRFSHLYIIPA